MKQSIAISLLIGQLAWGWSAEGHRAVADIAESILMESGRYAAVKAILGDLTLSEIATCPDELRAFQRNPKVPMSAPCQEVFGASASTGTESWHYINIPISMDTPSDSDIANVCRNACVVEKINAYGVVLAAKSASKSERLQALSFVVHFIGDVHQAACGDPG